ncbi:hypothetical protein [Hydrotalea sp.]|uniref:hypothetical protein n=1 Tax=Hydrotalea sp. TaxID=2881279 RepID=UPI0026134C7D|nr:hypothetical protein [Hydrotalea sp.]
MNELLFPYLLVHQRLGIPGIGSFQLVRTAPEVDWEQKTVHPPVQQISFVPETMEADHHFYRTVAQQLNITEVAAIQQFTEFSYQLREQLQQGGALLPGIGTLLLNPDGEVFFRPVSQNNQFSKNISFQHMQLTPAASTSNSEPVSISDTIPAVENVTANEEVPAENETKDNWWIYAIILTVIGLVASLIAFL